MTTSRRTCSSVVHAGPNLISTCWIAYTGLCSFCILHKPSGFSQGNTALQLPPMRSMEMYGNVINSNGFPLGFKLQEAPTTSKDSCKSFQPNAGILARILRSAKSPNQQTVGLKPEKRRLTYKNHVALEVTPCGSGPSWAALWQSWKAYTEMRRKGITWSRDTI